MLKGKTLVELAQAVQDAAARKMDVVADTRNIEFRMNDENKPTLSMVGKSTGGDFQHIAIATPNTVKQITEYTGIPAKYAERMMTEDTELMEINVNRWFQRKPGLRMVRTMRNGTLSARAFLSNRYRRMEHEQHLNVLLPEITDGSVEIMSTELTERRMYLKVSFPALEGEVKRGDVVRWGFTFTNSEIGEGRYSVLPWYYRLVCTNGAVASSDIVDIRLTKTHIGKALEEQVDYLSDETIQADDVALSLRLRDTIRAFKDPAVWAGVLARLQAAAGSSAAADPIVTVERAATILQLPKPEHNLVLANFLKGGDFTRWGLSNAITEVANDRPDYDRASELERAGGSIITLPDSDWRELARAA